MSSPAAGREKRFRVTFVAPSQHMTSGGAYVIQQLALHCASHMEVNLVVEEGEPQPLVGVATYPADVLESAERPQADALVIPADDPSGEQLFSLSPDAGEPVLLFQGYGAPRNPATIANLERADRVVAVASWLDEEAKRFGCLTELIRPGFDRSIFFPGTPTGERAPSLVMMSSHIEWKGTWDGLAAIDLARRELPELTVELFGHLEPGVPDASFTPVPDRAVIAEALRRAMVFVCPSWEEGLGLPGIEAMLCGASVATTDTKGSRDYALHDQTALVTPPREPAALAESIVRLIRGPALRRQLVANARSLVNETYPEWPRAGERCATALPWLLAASVPSPVSYHRPSMERESEPSVASAASERSAPASANGRYDFEIDLESGSTHARVVQLVGENKRVLELGPASGYMSRILVEHGCSVVGIELHPDMARQASPHLERVIVGDLETIDLEAELGESRFDVIVAADVLEHLRDPLDLLRRLRAFLAPDGFFVLSLPNVAHGSVRLALLAGRFPYQQRGLLDQTHLRFFTRETIEQLLDEAELGIAEIHHQQLNLDASEVPFDPEAVPPGVIERLRADPDAQTYQFVIKAIPFAGEGLRELQRRMRALAEEVARLREENEQLRPLQDAFAAISSREGQLRASLIDAHEQLLQRDEQLTQLREELEPLRRRINRVMATPIGRAYLKVRRARRIANRLAQRAERYRAALRKL